MSLPILGRKPLPPTDPTASTPEGGTTYDGTTYVSSDFIGGGATQVHVPERWYVQILHFAARTARGRDRSRAGSRHELSTSQYADNALAAVSIATDEAAGPPFQPAAGGTTAGTYPYYCLFHSGAEGMLAKITVTP